MMSRQVSKLLTLIQKENVRLCSTGPFLILARTMKDDGEDIVFNAAKEELITVARKPLPQQISKSMLIGASHGWGFYSDLCDRLCISDYLHPLTSISKPTKVIPLPPLTDQYTCRTIYNLAMSSSPCDHDEDWVVAIKFVDRKLSLCRPSSDTSWTDIVAPFSFTENSNLMYSKRGHRFYLPHGTGSNHLCSWDIHFKKDDSPKVHNFLYKNRPKSSQSEYELLESCSMADHWVESASGERFLVKCFSPVSPDVKRNPVFMVFRAEETTENGTIMCYTEDIGDVCIFMSGTDPFCVEASSCPGLTPNSIYLMESVFGVYNIATRDIRHFEDQVEGPLRPEEVEFTFLPYWLPPICI